MAAHWTKWTKEVTVKLIGLFEQQECLWNVKNKDYQDRDKRERAFQKICNVLQLYIPNLQNNEVKAKLFGIRSQFRRQLRELELSKRNGSEASKKPSFWCFELLEFLRPVIAIKSPEDVLFVNNFSNKTDLNAEPHITEKIHTILPTASSSTSTRKSQRKRKKRPITDFVDEILPAITDSTIVDSAITDSRDTELGHETQFNYAAKGWAITLNELPKDQQLFATRIINEVLFQAQMGCLSLDSKLLCSQPTIVSQPDQFEVSQFTDCHALSTTELFLASENSNELHLVKNEQNVEQEDEIM